MVMNLCNTLRNKIHLAGQAKVLSLRTSVGGIKWEGWDNGIIEEIQTLAHLKHRENSQMGEIPYKVVEREINICSVRKGVKRFDMAWRGISDKGMKMEGEHVSDTSRLMKKEKGLRGHRIRSQQISDPKWHFVYVEQHGIILVCHKYPYLCHSMSGTLLLNQRCAILYSFRILIDWECLVGTWL